MAVFWGIGYVAHNGATPRFKYAIRSRVASDESQEEMDVSPISIIKLRRKPSSPNFCRKPEKVACRSMLNLLPDGECCTDSYAGSRRRTSTIAGAWNVGGEASRS